MRTDELNEQISEALRDAPPAPEALRHNVMAAIQELEYTRAVPKNRLRKTVSALACVAVFAVVVIVARPILSNKSFDNAMSNNTGSYSTSAESAPADAGGGTDYGSDTITGGFDAPVGPRTFAMQEFALAPPGSVDQEYAIDDSADSTGVSYVVSGDFPEELEELEYTANPDASRVYENVPDEIIELLLTNNTFITEAPVEGTGNVIKWTP